MIRTSHISANADQLRSFLCNSFIILVLSLPSIAQTPVPVFPLGADGYACYRIPALLALPDGRLLAFAEGRKNNCRDFGNVDIVMKTSRNGGKTWSEIRVLVDSDSLQASNCAPVLDLLDPAYPKGRIFLFYNTGNATEHEVMQGRGLREVWFISSTDGGQSWSAPVNITRQTHRPGSPPYHDAAAWRGYANTPGHAIQLTQKPYRGRIFVAANHTEGPPKSNWGNCYSHGFYTDDHGKTFQLGGSVPVPGSNEAIAAEIPGGGLLINCRNQAGQPRRRIQAWSSDGGATWQNAASHPDLVDPVCQGTMLTVFDRRKPRLLFLNPSSETRR
ncbi:MAG TPA: exo-alpha-sialidase, partial [Saprospirales bacterium]|nr:exo-alpha-sialidase [Saprospirales bacterium]